jgi:nitric oxide reductase activation protein
MGFKLSSFGVAAAMAVKALPAHSYFSASRSGKRRRPEFKMDRVHADSLRHNVRVNTPSNHPLAERRLNHGVARDRVRSAESSAVLSDIWCIA